MREGLERGRATDRRLGGLLAPIAAGAAAAAWVGTLEALLRLATTSSSPGLDLGVLGWAARGYALAGGAVGLVLGLLSRAAGRFGLGPVFVPRSALSPNGARADLQAWFVAELAGWIALVVAMRFTSKIGVSSLASAGLELGLALFGGFLAARLVAPRVCHGRGPGALSLALALLLLEVAAALAPAVLGPLVFSTDDWPRSSARLAGFEDANDAVREPRGPPTSERPDVVVVTLDTTRADHLSTYGYERETSPQLTRLALDGLRFERAVSASSWTLPTHASMFTGLFPRSHGARFRTEPAPDGAARPGAHSTALPLDPVHTTMAEILRAKGYRTGGFVAGPYLYANYGVAQGFDWYDDRIFVSVGQRLTLFTWLARLYRHAETDLADFDLGYRRAADLNQSVFEWLGEQGSERVFLFVNYFDAHGPLRPVRAVRDLFPGSELPVTRQDVEHVYAQVMSGAGTVPDDVRRWMVSQYDAELRYQDRELGALLDRLRRDGRYDQALILVLADHGEHLGEDGLIGHGFTLNEPVTHVPLIVKPPKQDGVAPGVRDELVHQVDLLPTVLARLGIDPAEFSPSLPGGSLLDPHASHRAFSELYPDPYRIETFGTRWRREVVGWASGENQLLLATPTTVAGQRAEEWTPRELYGSIGRGPEGPPLVDPERARELEAELEAWLETLPVHVPSRRLFDLEGAGGAAAALGAVGYAGN